VAAKKEAMPLAILNRLGADSATGTIYYYASGHTVFGVSAVRAFKREMKAALAKESVDGKDKA